MARYTFPLALPLGECRMRIRKTFEEHRELMKKHQEVKFCGEFVDDNRFWIQCAKATDTNSLNSSVKAAPKLSCELVEAGSETRLVVKVPRPWKILAPLLAGTAVFGLFSLWQLAHFMGISGVHAYSPKGMGVTMGLTITGTLCTIMMFGWRKDEATTVRFSVLKAAGLFGARKT
jgi:hypothetical protein